MVCYTGRIVTLKKTWNVIVPFMIGSLVVVLSFSVNNIQQSIAYNSEKTVECTILLERFQTTKQIRSPLVTLGYQLGFRRTGTNVWQFLLSVGKS